METGKDEAKDAARFTSELNIDLVWSAVTAVHDGTIHNAWAEVLGDGRHLKSECDELLLEREQFRQQIAALEAQLKLRNDELRALKYTVVATIVATVGGVDYEGFPTCELNYLQRLRILVEKEAELEAQLADKTNRSAESEMEIGIVANDLDSAENEVSRLQEQIQFLTAALKRSEGSVEWFSMRTKWLGDQLEAKDAELREVREVREQYDNLRQWEQIAKHVSRQQAQRILALEAALRHVANLCHTAAIQHKCESCSGHAKIAEDALSPSSPQTASKSEGGDAK